MSVSYNQSAHDALNGDSSHFDADFYQNDSGSFANMDPSLSSAGVDTLNNTAAAANAHLAGTSSAYNAMLAHEASMSSGAGRQSLGGDDSLSITAMPVRSGKASRACDECRRRKSKCTDGNPDTGQACAPCRARCGPEADCHYNRTPMKRGPSKGYIQAMKGNVDDVSRGQRKVLSHVDYLKVELETVKDQLSKLVDFITKKFGPDALEPALSREEIIKRVRFSADAIPDTHVLSLDGQKAVSQYQAKFQSVLPFLPTDAILFQNVMEQATEGVQNAFEYALRAIDTPVYSGTEVDLTRAEFIAKANASLDKQAYGALYLATVGILMLAIQTTGPVSEYKGKMPNMLSLHEKAISSFTSLHIFEEPNPVPAEQAYYVRCVTIGIRSLLMITSIGSGEIFAIIDEIAIPTSDEANLISEPCYRFAQLAETFHGIFRAGLSSQPINFGELSLYDTDLPLPSYKIVVLTLQLLVCRLNTFTDTPDPIEIIAHLNNVIDHLYLSTTSDASTSLGPTCWLYYHGLALAIKTAFDLSQSDDATDTTALRQAAILGVQKLKSIIGNLPIGALSGWEHAAMSTLNRFLSTAPDSSTISSGRWRDILVKDAYLRALDY